MEELERRWLYLRRCFNVVGQHILAKKLTSPSLVNVIIASVQRSFVMDIQRYIIIVERHDV